MKSTFLKVMGILLIIFGAIGIISSLTSFSAYVFMGMVPIGILALVDAVIELVAGIAGVSSASDKRKASGCIVWGIILIAIVIIILIAEAATGIFELYSYVGMGYMLPMTIVFSLILPVLYFLAAFTFVRKK